MTKTKSTSTRESLAFESTMLIFAASNFSFDRKVHHPNFQFIVKTRDIKLPVLMKF